MQKLLIIEDDEDIREAVGIALELNGYEAILAASPDEALDALERETPALIVLDYMLPRMTGAELCARLRSEGNETPVLLLSADKEIVRKSEGCGANRVMKKPFDIADLLAAIEDLTSRARASGRHAPWQQPEVALEASVAPVT